ncbi:glycoside hydrolase family 92 protein [bacterium]|nr:MAG: glycoside hydrolase family 92 protein [bacterium]
MPNGLLRYVNLLQGTDSHHGFSTGNTLPIVALPFGMNHWSAQTAEGRWFFSPKDKKLQGIRCTHQPSPWMADYGHFTVMANTGDERHLSPGKRSRAYKGEFSPASFKATLLNDGTTIEMAPTTRGAIFRFRFPEGVTGRVIIEPCAGESRMDRTPSGSPMGEIRGNSGGVPEGFAHHFVASFDRQPDRLSNFRGEELTEDIEGDRVGIVAEFEGGGEVVLRLATSFISGDQAHANLQEDGLQTSLETVVDLAERAWEWDLGRIQVESDDEDQLRTFYSCLYRTQLFPRVWHEQTPEGLKHRSPYDGGVHDGPLYTDNGFWDTYRTEYPLLALLQPDQLAEILQGWTNAYKEGGWFPQWATPGYRACMVGTHIDAVMADGIARGVTNFDVETALEGLLKHADQVGDPAGAWGRIGIEDYQKLGYVSTEHHESVARSLDYAYDDWCIAQIAQGDQKERLLQRAGSYENLYDPEVGFMRGKNADGTWLEPWNEFQWGSPYVEGGPWQSSWAVQHDAAGLIELMGGEAAFVAKLDRMLTTPPYFTTGAYGFEIHEMTEMAHGGFGQYAHSNQPVHHVLYLYNAAGRPWRTQKEARRVMDELYTPTHLAGDEDNGEMCAWYVLSALGLFPLTPGHASWTLGSPLFKRATVTLPNGKALTLEAPENSKENVYVRSVTLNGQKIDRLFLTHDEVAQGGTLTFTMSSTPDETITPAEARPYSMTSYR